VRVFDVEKTRVLARVVLKPLFHGRALLTNLVRGEIIPMISEYDRRSQYKMIVEFQRQMRIICRAHHFVDFFASPDTDDFLRQPSPAHNQDTGILHCPDPQNNKQTR